MKLIRAGITGKSVKEALILESVNPQYDEGLFIDIYKKNTSSQHVVYKYCFECQNKNKITIFVHNIL